MLARFKRTFPKISIKLLEYPRDRIETMLMEGNTCDSREVFEMFGFEPLPFSEQEKQMLLESVEPQLRLEKFLALISQDLQVPQSVTRH